MWYLSFRGRTACFLVILSLKSIAAAAQPSSPKTPPAHTLTSSESVAAWTAAEKESLKQQIACFSGLRELSRQNATVLQEVRQLIPVRGDPPFPRGQIGGSSSMCQESLKELESLVKMAKDLQQVAVSLATTLQVRSVVMIQRGRL